MSNTVVDTDIPVSFWLVLQLQDLCVCSWCDKVNCELQHDAAEQYTDRPIRAATDRLKSPDLNPTEML